MSIDIASALRNVLSLSGATAVFGSSHAVFAGSMYGALLKYVTTFPASTSLLPPGRKLLFRSSTPGSTAERLLVLDVLTRSMMYFGAGEGETPRADAHQCARFAHTTRVVTSKPLVSSLYGPVPIGLCGLYVVSCSAVLIVLPCTGLIIGMFKTMFCH